MDLAFSLLLMLHLIALVVGGATNVAMPLVGRQMTGAAPEALARLGPVAKRLRLNSHVALAVLIVTGVFMLSMRYDGDVAALGPWFLGKLALVAVLFALLVASLVLKPGAVSPQVLGMTTRIALIGIVVCSVMTFG